MGLRYWMTVALAIGIYRRVWKKGCESNCAEDASNDEPFSIDSQQAVAVIFEPNSGEEATIQWIEERPILG
jgi:hypothetical protein